MIIFMFIDKKNLHYYFIKITFFNNINKSTFIFYYLNKSTFKSDTLFFVCIFCLLSTFNPFVTAFLIGLSHSPRLIQSEQIEIALK